MPLQHWVRVRPWHCLCISEFTVWVQMHRAKTGGLWFKCLRLEVCLDSIGHRCPLELPCWGQHCSWAPRKRSHGQQQNICNYVDWKMPRQHRHTGLPLCSVSSGSKSLLQVWTKLTFSFIKQFIQDCTCNVSFQRTCNNQEHSDSMRSLPTSKHHRTRQIIFSCLQL